MQLSQRRDNSSSFFHFLRSYLNHKVHFLKNVKFTNKNGIHFIDFKKLGFYSVNQKISLLK